MASKDRLREAAEKRIKELSRLRQRSLRQRISDYGPQEQYTEELEREMKRHGSLSGRKSRGLRGLGATPKQHADKAYNAANKAILKFKRSQTASCQTAFDLFIGAVALRGEAQAHADEAIGKVARRIGASDRSAALNAEEGKAHRALVQRCMAGTGLHGTPRRRRTARRSKR